MALAGENDQNITSFGFSVSPETVAPGGTVTLKSDGCEVPSVTVTSGVFDTVTLNEGRSGNATVDVDAKAGAQYEISFDCKGERGTTTLTIAQGNTGGNTTGHNESMPPAAHKGVKAGLRHSRRLRRGHRGPRRHRGGHGCPAHRRSARRGRRPEPPPPRRRRPRMTAGTPGA